MTGCTFSENRATGGDTDGTFGGFSDVGGDGNGGAIYNGNMLILVNTTFSGNSSKGGSGRDRRGQARGGGLFNPSGAIGLTNVTLFGNSAAGSFIFGDQVGIGTKNGTVTLHNSIIASALPGTNVVGPITDGGNNICSDASCHFTALTSFNNTDPILGSLADNGGRTPMLALLAGSPAIDAGNNDVCPATDQRGVARPIGRRCDIGAFEFVPGPTLVRGPNGNVRVQFVAQPVRTHAIQASTNLIEWTPIGTVTTDADGKLDFNDFGAVNLSSRFYRTATP